MAYTREPRSYQPIKEAFLNKSKPLTSRQIINYEAKGQMPPKISDYKEAYKMAVLFDGLDNYRQTYVDRAIELCKEGKIRKVDPNGKISTTIAFTVDHSDIVMHIHDQFNKNMNVDQVKESVNNYFDYTLRVFNCAYDLAALTGKMDNFAKQCCSNACFEGRMRDLYEMIEKLTTENNLINNPKFYSILEKYDFHESFMGVKGEKAETQENILTMNQLLQNYESVLGNISTEEAFIALKKIVEKENIKVIGMDLNNPADAAVIRYNLCKVLYYEYKSPNLEAEDEKINAQSGPQIDARVKVAIEAENILQKQSVSEVQTPSPEPTKEVNPQKNMSIKSETRTQPVLFENRPTKQYAPEQAKGELMQRKEISGTPQRSTEMHEQQVQRAEKRSVDSTEHEAKWLEFKNRISKLILNNPGHITLNAHKQLLAYLTNPPKGHRGANLSTLELLKGVQALAKKVNESNLKSDELKNIVSELKQLDLAPANKVTPSRLKRD